MVTLNRSENGCGVRVTLCAFHTHETCLTTLSSQGVSVCKYSTGNKPTVRPGSTDFQFLVVICTYKHARRQDYVRSSFQN
jgi:hypothetical protein